MACESASLYYFNKHAEKIWIWQKLQFWLLFLRVLTIYNPFENPKANKERREHLVLDQMVKFGYITQAECDKAKAENIVFNKHKDNKKDLRSYFFDYVSPRVY
jgi:penicillin-binding protein 1A